MLNKSNILYYLTIVLLGALGLRLLQLQILEHEKYKSLAKNNTTKTSITRAPRGIIYDRQGEILATSKQSLSVIVYPAALRKPSQKQSVAKTLSNFISMSFDELNQLFKKMDPSTPLPITLDNDIDIEAAIKIFENRKYLPGIFVEKQATRYYPLGDAFAHLIGYVGQINNEELKEGRSRGLGLGDIVGKEGLEKVFDNKLQGTKGEARVSVDRYGRSLKTEGIQKKIIQKAVKGDDLHLTVDSKIQDAAYQAIKDMKAAAVVINPKNGEVYALVSTPSFDPNIFTKPVPTTIYNQLVKDKAFLNRAISAYTPGSIWKPISAIAALEHGVANINEYLEVGAGIDFAGSNFGDWTDKEGIINLIDALAWSRNTFFYQIGKRMEPEWIADTGRKFSAGQSTGIELLGESKGVLPDPDWKRKHLKESWFPGNTLHYTIGQSFLMLTPLQAVRIIAAIANNGKLPQLHLIQDPTKENLQSVEGISQDSYQIIKTGLEKCVNSGTGVAAQVEGIKIAGKTGSAEVQGYQESTHGWFAGYAPIDDPQIALVVFAEGAGHGGTVAAPAAQKIFSAWFNHKPEDKDKQVIVNNFDE